MRIGDGSRLSAPYPCNHLGPLWVESGRYSASKLLGGREALSAPLKLSPDVEVDQMVMIRGTKRHKRNALWKSKLVLPSQNFEFDTSTLVLPY